MWIEMWTYIPPVCMLYEMNDFIIVLRIFIYTWLVSENDK